LLAHQGTPPPLLSEKRPDAGFSPALEAVVMKALRKDQADRFGSAAEMARALEACPEVTTRRAASGHPAVERTPTPAPAPAPRNETMVLGSDAMIPIAPAPVPVPVPVPVARRTRPPILSKLPPYFRTRQGIAVAIVASCALLAVIALIAAGGDKPAARPPAAVRDEPAEVEMPGDNTSAELARLKARVKGGNTSEDVVRALHRLAAANPRDPEVPLVLGQIYVEKLWVDDGLEQFRKAIRLDDAMRSDPRLLRSVMYGLGADKRYGAVRRFLVDEIGAPAVPFLEEVLTGRWRKEVKDRAAATLRELGT
jgi:serine/threonine-protein kinase